MFRLFRSTDSAPPGASMSIVNTQASRSAEAIENREIFPAQDPHALISAIDEIQQALLGIA